MSAVVDLVEDIVDGVDKYIVQPIAQDPLTFIATVAGAAILGPAAAGYFGTSATIGAGIGAAVGNTAAGLAQGEDFDEAIKGGALAGVTTWAGGELVNKFGAPSAPTSEAAALQKGITSTADDFGSAALQSTDDIFSSVAKESAKDALGNPITYGDDLIAPSAKNWGMSSLDDVATGSLDDSLFNPIDQNIGMAGKGPNASFGKPSSQLPNATTTDAAGNVMGRDMYGQYTNAPNPAGESVYTGTKMSGAGAQRAFDTGAGVVDDSIMMLDEAAARDPNFYLKADAAAESAAANRVLDTAGTNASILNSPVGKYGTGYNPSAPVQPSMWDKALGYGKDAYNWAVDNPAYSVPLALTGLSLLGNKDEPPDGGGGNKDQIGDSRFYKSLPLLNMRRQQMDYGDDIYSYGTTGGEAQFFSPTVYEPIKYASGGSVMPEDSGYSYYTYGSIPRTMRRFAKGGLGSLSKSGGFDGRSDDIPAVLSDGEFVIDAETVALLGNGSSKAGANRLEEMRQAVRKQKGGALSRGKFSPDAKSPLAYLKSSKRGRG